MQAYGSSCVKIILLVMTQLVGPVSVWAAESQRAAKGESPRRAVVSGLRGEVFVSPADTTREPQPLRFHDGVSSGDQLTTGAGGVVEVLVGRHALVTLDEDSSLQFLDESPGHTVLQLTKGEVRLAVARAEDTLTVHTPTATTVTRGGLIRINVIPGKRQASRQRGDGEAHAMPVAFTQPIPAAGPGQPGQVETIQVMEGTVQLKSSTPGASLVNVEAGQNVQVVAGQAGKPFPIPSAPVDKYALPAAEPHARTPEAGMRNLVAQQRTQAEALQRVLLGPGDVKNPLKQNAATAAFLSTDGVIISTTGAGLTLSQEQPDLASLFAPGSLFAAGSLTPREVRGTGIADDTTTPTILVLHGTVQGQPFFVKGGIGEGLVVFDRHTIQAKSEVVLVDGGAPGLAPPTESIVVTPSPRLPMPSVSAPRSHTGLPIQIDVATTPPALPTATPTVGDFNRDAEVFITTPGPVPPNNPITDLGQYTRNHQPGSVLVAPTNQGGRSLVDGIVRARSDITGGRTVVLAGGAILNNNTRLIASFSQDAGPDPALPTSLLPPGNATRLYFAETGQPDVINGSIVGMVAKRDSTSTLLDSRSRACATTSGRSSVLPTACGGKSSA